MAISNGRAVGASDLGGGILNDGATLTVSNCVLQNNYADVVVYPNPNNGAFSVSVNVLADEKNTSFILTDLAGRVIYKEQLDTHAGLNAYQINTGNIAKGTYFFEISNAQAKTVKKIIVQ